MNFHVYNECQGEHVHEHPQILVPLHQTMKICIGKSDYEVTPQELCVIPPGMNHQCHFFSKLLAINLYDEMSEKTEGILISYPMIISMRGQIMELVHLIQSELKQNPNSKSVRYLYSYLYSKLMDNSVAPSIRYMIENYDQPITVSKLAEIENYNVTYYNDWFKQQTGFSPSLYLRYVRINKAKDLLANTKQSVMDIAMTVGYSSNSTFTRAFHCITGMSPKDYRQCSCN